MFDEQVRDRNGHEHGTSVEDEITDGPQLETIERKPGQMMERRTRQTLKGYHLAEDSARQADVEQEAAR